MSRLRDALQKIELRDPSQDDGRRPNYRVDPPQAALPPPTAKVPRPGPAPLTAKAESNQAAVASVLLQSAVAYVTSAGGIWQFEVDRRSEHAVSVEDVFPPTEFEKRQEPSPADDTKDDDTAPSPRLLRIDSKHGLPNGPHFRLVGRDDEELSEPGDPSDQPANEEAAQTPVLHTISIADSDDSIAAPSDPAEPEEFEPDLDSIESDTSPDDQPKVKLADVAKVDDRNADEPFPEPEPHSQPALLGGSHRFSDKATAYGYACDTILASIGQDVSRTIAIASAGRPCETASVVRKIGVAMTDRFDRSVLLIDLTHEATLTRELGIEPSGAVMQVLRGTARWHDEIVQSTTPGLCLLPSRAGDDRFAPFAFKQLLADLQSEFDLVLVDLGSVDQASTLPLSRTCTGTVLTLQLNATTKVRARRAERQIRAAGGTLIGSMLVEWRG